MQRFRVFADLISEFHSRPMAETELLDVRNASPV
jgi:hypothetical protein